MIIVPMQSAHIDEILAIERTTSLPVHSRESYEALLLHDTISVAVACDAATHAVKGYVEFLMVSDECHLHTLAVYAADRRQKIGQRLLQYMLDTALGRGCRRAYLESRPSNLAALALYRKLGFEEQGRRFDYYVNPKEDAVILLKTLANLG